MFELLFMIFLVPVFTVIFLLLRFGLYLLKLSARGCLWIVKNHFKARLAIFGFGYGIRFTGHIGHATRSHIDKSVVGC